MNEPADVAPWIERLARVGYVASGAPPGTLRQGDADRHCRRGPWLCLLALRAGGLKESLAVLAEVGRRPLAAVGLGLVAYRVYELVNARYRRIQVD